MSSLGSGQPLLATAVQGKGDRHARPKIDNHDGIIFSSSIMPITVTLNPETEIEFDSLEILISDRNENVVCRKGLTKSSLGTSFAWDLKSERNAYVHSGCYSISLIASNSSEKNQMLFCTMQGCRHKKHNRTYQVFETLSYDS